MLKYYCSLTKSGKRVESVEFQGITFRRYPDSERICDRRYFRANAKHINNGVKALHVEVWKAKHGCEVPDGFHIHHRDDNASNNEPDNLEAIKAFDHHSLHGRRRTPAKDVAFKKAQAAAAGWHGTEAGLQFHHELGLIAAKAKAANPLKKICQQCQESFETACRGRARFCSNACKSAFRRKSGVDDEDRVCPQCHGVFRVGKYLKKVTCSRSCSMKYGWATGTNIGNTKT